MSKKSAQYRVSTVPCLIEETGRVYIGCDIHGQRFEVSVCDGRRCKHRKKCRQYQAALRMKEDLENNKPKRRRKRKSETGDDERKKRRRRVKEVVTKSKRRRRRVEKTDKEDTGKLRRRKSKARNKID